MKRLSLIPTIVLALASLVSLPSCSYEGRVIDSHHYQMGGRTFVQKRILLCENPRETRVISYEVW